MDIILDKGAYFWKTPGFEAFLEDRSHEQGLSCNNNNNHHHHHHHHHHHNKFD